MGPSQIRVCRRKSLGTPSRDHAHPSQDHRDRNVVVVSSSPRRGPPKEAIDGLGLCLAARASQMYLPESVRLSVLLDPHRAVRLVVWLAVVALGATSCSGKAEIGGPAGKGGGGPGQGGGSGGEGATAGGGGAPDSHAGGAGGSAPGGQSGSGPAGRGGAASANGSGTASAGGQVVRVCQGVTMSLPDPRGCRADSECPLPGPVKCCTTTDCWPASVSCPLPPTNCPAFQCMTSDDCNAGGTCVSTVGGCPRCEARACHYPPPPCTQVPDSCGADARCQADGTCKPLLCTEGHTCVAPYYRCNPTGGRADASGCELVPCDAGWTCEENTRCTNPGDKVSHGCTTLACKSDVDCDCGYCVNGGCSASIGHCSSPPS